MTEPKYTLLSDQAKADAAAAAEAAAEKAFRERISRQEKAKAVSRRTALERAETCSMEEYLANRSQFRRDIGCNDNDYGLRQ
ncbi:hypothetical protein Pla52o_48130 [Novipirellula galeiformis]|uniref:Uncharacterized protein n=1 Tax=Novipirellula galeiformis TaxID=2528004 RepID=A0A5C6CA68_9BACT|nr:hypothetical protein Pla52o_48130 [Novipirellula galeiformis]